MKKIYRLLFACILIASATEVSAQCAGFSDGFESGSHTPTWVNGTGSYTSRQVVTTSPAVGTYCFEAVGGNSHYNGISTTIPASTPDYISYYVKNAAATTSAYFVIGDNNTSTNNGIAFIYMRSAGDIRFVNGGTGLNIPYTTGLWYHIELKNIDWVAKDFDIWVNGVQQATNFAFRSQTTTQITDIHLYNWSSATAYWDEINIGGVPVTFTSNITDPACNGDSTGAISLNVTGGTPGYGYAWSTGDTVDSLANLPAGTYWVDVTDSAGCAETDTFTVAEPAALASAISTTDLLCNGGTDGAADLTASGGTPGYSYAWSSGDSTEDLDSVMAGMYTVTITDSNGCTQVDTATIGEPTAISLATTPTYISCNGETDGSVDLSASGGTPGYTYMWSSGDSTEDLDSLAAGTYSVTVTDSNGCIMTDSATVAEPAALGLSAAVTDETAGMDGAIDLTVSGGTPGFTYSWSNGATTEDISGLAPGTYTVTVTDMNGCVVVDSFVVGTQISVTPGKLPATVSIFPNPTNGQLNVDLKDLTAVAEFQIRLLDVSGKAVLDAGTEIVSGAASQRIELAGLTAGVYLLELRLEDAVGYYRVVKK